MKPIKLENGVLIGCSMPAHIGRAYGRYIFKLLHTDIKPRVDIWPRDLPSNILDLDYDFGISEPIHAYLAECDRIGVPLVSRVGA